MPASIAAKPNPVLISHWNFTGKGNSTITWDTGSNVLRGRVYLSIDGGAEALFDGGTNPTQGSRTNSSPPKVLTVELGKRYVLRLRQVNSAGTQLASIDLTAQEQLGVPPKLVDEIPWRIRLKQRIYDLRVVPGIDTVRLIFRTTQPATPLIILEDGVYPFLAPRDLIERKAHDVFVPGPVKGLRQNTDHTYRIIAAAYWDSLNQAGAEVSGRFRTGSRTVQFLFDKIRVRNDGDPGLKGAGEFKFVFGAGNAVPRHPSEFEPLSNIESYGRADISDDDPPVDVARIVTVPFAPPQLWAQVVAFEDDDDPFTPGLGLRGMKPGYEPPGSMGTEDANGVWVTVTQHFDVRDLPTGTDIPFEMASGSFGIAYTAYGRLRIDARPGTFYLSLGRAKRPGVKISQVATLRRSAASALVGLDPDSPQWMRRDREDGALYRWVAAEGGPPQGQWASLGGSCLDTITVVATAPDRFVLFAIDADGSLVCREGDSEQSYKHEWTCLGGHYVGPVSAVPTADGRINLFVSGQEGQVFHGVYSHGDCGPAMPEWRPLGNCVTGSLTALGVPAKGAALLALDQQGTILHKRMDGDGWLPSDMNWERLGTAPAGLFSAGLVDDETVLLAVLSDDEQLFALPWHSYPHEFPADVWQMVGNLDTLLASRLSLLDRASTGTADDSDDLPAPGGCHAE